MINSATVAPRGEFLCPHSASCPLIIRGTYHSEDDRCFSSIFINVSLDSLPSPSSTIQTFSVAAAIVSMSIRNT